jgi:hypothetical protein
MSAFTPSTARMFWFVVTALVLGELTGPAAAVGDIPAPLPAPVAWGLTAGHEHCVIFREYKKTKGAFYLVVVTTKTHMELEVIESDGFNIDPKTYIEDQPTMDALNSRALNERLRYVKVQDKYTPAELQAARDLCKNPSLVK